MKMTYNTERKNEIIRLFSESADTAFTTEEICSKILNGGAGKSTVYRIISELVHEGAIKKISDEHTRRVVYQYLGEKKCSEHLHLKCRVCGRLIHLDRAASERILNLVKDCGSFSLDPTEILSGICDGCI